MSGLCASRSNAAAVLLLIGLSSCVLIAAGCRRAGPAAGPITIEAVSQGSAAGNLIQVRGLSQSELDALGDARLDQAGWEALLRVTVTDDDQIAVIGRYHVTSTALEFRPLFPFDLGRSYTAAFDVSRLPSPRREPAVTARIRFAAPDRTPTTAVTAIFPSADVWPENMLRFYVHFSAPMSQTNGVKFIRLMDDAGQEVPDAILAAYADLWNDDGTRLTVFFDPGRVKRGVGPNAKMGRAIVKGRKYAIAIDRAWPDGVGQPLTGDFRREFTAGPAAYDAIDLDDWHLSVPKAGSTGALEVKFPAPLDRALLDRAIGVRLPDGAIVAGRSATLAHEQTWAFTPAEPWKAGAYELAVLTLLEDPAGNKVGQPFEVLPDTIVKDTPSEIATLTFRVN